MASSNNKTNINEQVRPQDNFFQYVNGKWIKDNPIPSDRSMWGSFYILRDKVDKRITGIIKQIDTDTTDNTGLKQLGRYYLCAMNFQEYSDNHISTIQKEIDKIESIKSIDQLSEYIGYIHQYDINPFWSCYVDYDDKNCQNKILRLVQDGLTLPNRDYYLSDDTDMTKIRKKYELFFQILCQKLSIHITPPNWESVISIENQLAKISWKESELRDISKTYHKFSVSNLDQQFENFNWLSYFKNQNWVKPSGDIIINQPDYIKNVLNLINKSDINKIKDYLKWQLITNTANLINKDYEATCFDFFAKVLSGKQKMAPLWKRVIWRIEKQRVFDDIISQEYVKKYFPSSSKDKVEKIANDIKIAFKDRIIDLTWMEEATKQIALRKLEKIKILVGYPSTWRNFGDLSFCPDNYVQNFLDANKAWSDHCISKIGKVTEHDEWNMEAHAVNACSEFNQLIVCFPAGILQPPFFDPKASYATNLGAIGSIIGHELTHSFDDQGVKFDENGNWNQWLSETEQKRFEKSVSSIINQANNFEALPGLKLDGQLVAGEAVADLGGIEIAVAALHNNQGKNTSSLRQLFNGYAQAECTSCRKEVILDIVKSDPHPISEFRVNSILSNVDSFYLAYNLKPSDKLYISQEKRAKIW